MGKPAERKKCLRCNERFWIYLAGLLDGEGYFGFNYVGSYPNQHRLTPYFAPRVTISLTNEKLLRFLKEYIGFGCLRKVKVYNKKHKDCWTLLFPSLMAYKVVKKIYPFLILKRRMAKLILMFYGLPVKTWIKKRGDITPPELVEVRKKLYLKAKELNHRGRKNESV